MSKHIFTIIFSAGALVLLWIGAGFVNGHLLALVMTLLIAAAYGLGTLELQRFRQCSATLAQALADIPDGLTQLGDWLARVPPGLQNPVRLRIEGERIGLPGPTLTPYLVGLLVMLGMLGTFLGMVVTLNGAAFSLEGTSDLQAIRSAFATPIKGLGLAFGTSVAGVASSAMLGLMSALSRRERLLVAQQLDSRIATQLRSFSLTHQRQEAFKALQLQSQALPAVVNTLQAMMQQMAQMNQQMNERLLGNQERFHSDVQSVYTQLASAVDQSLRHSLTESAQAAGNSIRPVLEAAMHGMAQEASQMHTQIASGMEHALQAFNTSFEQRSAALLASVQQAYRQMHTEQRADEQQRLGAWSEQLAAMAGNTQANVARLVSSSEDLVRSRISAEAQWTEQHGQRMEQLGTLMRTELSALRDAEALRGQAAADHLGQLRQEISDSVARDNALLEERSRIMETLSALLDSINHASGEQRAVIDTLVASAAVALQHAGSQFSEQIGAEASKLSDLSAHVSSGALEISSLGETFALAVQSFQSANDQLVAHLQRIESALDKSMARSDDQLAYYVAQARELIDLSIHSQKDIVEELRQLGSKQAALAEEAL